MFDKVSKISTPFFQLVFLVIGLATVFFIFYLFAFQYLQGPLIGNDVPNAFIYIKWLDQYWPKIPIWWPEQGGGGSFIYGHQIGSYFIILFLHKVLGLTLIQGMRLLGFFSIYLTCVGIYFLTWHKTKSQIASFLASIFYLISDVTWRWLFDMGLYAQSVSFMYVPLLLILFDLYLAAYRKDEAKKKRIFLLLSAIVYALIVFTHIVTGTMMAIVLPLYALFYFQAEKWDRQRWWRFLDGIKASVLVGGLGLFLLAFWIFPYARLFIEEARDGVVLAAPHQIPYFNILSFFGFFPDVSKFEMWHVSTHLGVGILFLIGLVIAFFQKKTLFALGMVSLSFFLVMLSPSINFSFMNIFYKYFAMVGVRGVLVTSIIFPVLAGYGCVAIPSIIFSKIRFVGKILVFVTAMAIGFASIYFFIIPGEVKGCGKELYLGLGPSSNYVYCRFIQNFLKGKESLPPFSLGEEEIVDSKSTALFVSKLDPGINSRVDITPSLGNVMERWNIYTHTSQLSLYAYGLSLLRTMWGYEQWLFYGHQNTNPEEMVQAAKWFGIQRVLLKAGQIYDDINNYPGKYWNNIYSDSNSSVHAFELKEKVDLAEISSRPTFLVIGEHNLRAYEQIFRLANKGAFPYDNYFMVEGESKFVDDYSLSELNKFNGVVLHSYAFKNRKGGEGLLDQYVKEGGKLWIETGWQYTVPDWSLKSTPDYFPLWSQDWINLGIRNDYKLNKEIISGIDEKQFAPLDWKGAGWGFSSSRGPLKDWAIPVLTIDGYPLVIVGNYGKGKIIWSGMNLFSHAYDDKSAEEVRFVGALGAWLMGKSGPPNGNLTYIRDNPDKVEFNITKPGRWLLWKEAYSPGWRAKITIPESKSSSLKYYRAGPGWMLVYIPQDYQKENITINLTYVQSWAGYLGYLISFLTIIGFFLYLSGLDKRILGERKIELISAEKILRKIRTSWGRDEEG